MTSNSNSTHRPTTATPESTEADQLLQRGSLVEAIRLYEAHLQAFPHNPAPLLKLGICHLLNRSEHNFLAIYEQTKVLMASLTEVPAEIKTLWHKYEGLATKVTAGALVVGSLAVAGCSSIDDRPDTPPIQTTNHSSPPGGSDRPVNPPPATHKYGAGLYIPLEIEEPPASAPQGVTK